MSTPDGSPPNAPKFIMVTGAAGGIGRATVARLTSAGHVVFAANRKEGALQDLAEEFPKTHRVTLDVTEASPSTARSNRSKPRPRLRARRAHERRRHDDPRSGRGRTRRPGTRQFQINVFGLLAVTRAFLPQMRERKAGRIVNVSSVLGRFAPTGSGPSSASKFAVEAISDALRIELAPFGVRVVLVEPGIIDTPLYDKAAASLSLYDQALEPYRATWPAGFGFPERLLKAAVPAERAGAVLARAALASRPRDRYRPGSRSRLNTWLLTALPTRATDRIKAWIARMANAPQPETAAADPVARLHQHPPGSQAVMHDRAGE